MLIIINENNNYFYLDVKFLIIKTIYQKIEYFTRQIF